MRSTAWIFRMLLVCAVLAGAASCVIGTDRPSSGIGLKEADSYDATPPSSTVKLIFIHHSTGENWLGDGNGGLGLALMENNSYFVSDTNYGWGPDGIGDSTDIPLWYRWFTGPDSGTYLTALFTEYGQNPIYAPYSRLATDPGGPNTVVMFKSCFPNSAVGGSPDDPPAASADDTSPLTVANAKRIYLDMLDCFAAHQDKLFIAITAPPLQASDTNAAEAANARAFNNWLCTSWLEDYPHYNVAVFDFYNVLTSNGGDADTNDLGAATGNHHRWYNGKIERTTGQGSNYLAYPTSDSHPSSAGGHKASGEFIPFLNAAWNLWQNHP
jgi:hypothetical protein